jgi:DNA-directed RNA polymerase subunit M/transcription elongation factor TFIIS
MTMIEKHNDYLIKFQNLCLKKAVNFTFDKNGIDREKIRMYNFSTKIGNDFPIEILIEAENNINRKNAVEQIDKYLNNEMFSMELEKGLFEYVLIHVSSKKSQPHFCVPIYYNMLIDICRNLDQDDKSIDNQTLRPGILNGEIKPYYVAFLTPQQLHPKRWIQYFQKKAREDDAMNHVATYKDVDNKCKNCGGIEFHSYEQQLRSADEPANKFIICIDCGYTVIW